MVLPVVHPTPETPPHSSNTQHIIPTPSTQDMIESSLMESEFVQSRAPTPLRVTCYGSSSSKTPELYLREARQLGYILAKRGHTCINGAGSYGCMAAMNDGAIAGDGHLVGVIHEMWLVDHGGVGKSDEGSPTTTDTTTNTTTTMAAATASKQSKQGVTNRDGGTHTVFSGNNRDSPGPVREVLVARGADLQERKRLLVANTNALVVLPGGPGTWDELWEMACLRKLGLGLSLPICCINCNGFYGPFRAMLQRAYEDQLLDQTPDEILHFVDSAESAVRWVEQNAQLQPKATTAVNRSNVLRKSSFLGGDYSMGMRTSLQQSWHTLRSSFWEDGDLSPSNGQQVAPVMSWLLFVAGMVAGAALMSVYPDRTRLLTRN